MNSRFVFLSACLVPLILAACGRPPVVETPAPAMMVDHDRLAERIVTQSAGVRRGDQVLVSGKVEDMPLMEAIAVRVRKEGAFPLLTVTSDRLERRLYTDVPERYDAQPPDLELGLAGFLTAEISLLPESDQVYPGVAPERIVNTFAARRNLHELELKRRIRQVWIGNEVYPSRDRAERYGVTLEALLDNYWRGLDVDAARLRDAAEPLRRALANGHEVEITHRNGTSLRMRVEGRPILVNDGELKPACRQTGGASCMIWLPAGDIYLTPIPGTAEGRVFVENLLVQDTKVRGLTLIFRRGSVAEMTAISGIEAVRALYDAAAPGKERFSVLDIGLNPNVRDTPGSWLSPPVAAGMVSVGFGRDVWGGGDNDVGYGMALPIPGSTVSVDGKVIVAEGALGR